MKDTDLELIALLLNDLQEALSVQGPKALLAEWEGERPLVDERLMGDSPLLRIGLLGPTGSGKSSLLNALLGEKILPVGSLQSCTSALCEIESWRKKDFSAEVVFLTRTEWSQELTLLLKDLEALPLRRDPEVLESAWAAQEKL